MSNIPMHLFSTEPFINNVNGDLKIWFADGAYIADVFMEGIWLDLGSDADDDGDDVQIMLQGLVQKANVILLDSDDDDFLYVRKDGEQTEPKIFGDIDKLPTDFQGFLISHGWRYIGEREMWHNENLNVDIELPEAAVAVQQYINHKR